VEQFALVAGVSAAVIEDEGFLTLRNGRQVQHLEATLLLQVAGKVVLVHPLHDHNDAGRSLVVGARHNVERYQSMTRVRTASDMASPGFKGSSMTIRLPPRPVRVPSMEVAIRLPRLVVTISRSVSRARRMPGNSTHLVAGRDPKRTCHRFVIASAFESDHVLNTRWPSAIMSLPAPVQKNCILRRASMQSDQSSAANSKLEVADEVDEAALASVMRTVPLGAGVLAGAAVALLVLGYLLVYILVFLPRGPVG
jgi:hypothetical protein